MDYFAAAVKACGGKDKLPNENEMVRLQASEEFTGTYWVSYTETSAGESRYYAIWPGSGYGLWGISGNRYNNHNNPKTVCVNHSD